MHLPRRLHSLVLGCLAAALFTPPLSAGVQIDYSDGQTDATAHDTTPTLTLSILSGTATQSGVISGSGRLIKMGAGTLVLSGLNTYSNDTVVHFGTLQVAVGANMSQFPANIFIADGSGDTGTLLIRGGTVGGNSGYIGVHTGSSGTVTMSGGTWANADTLYLGNDGTGVLNLSGGTLSDFSGLVAWGQGSSGTANISGGTWTNGGNVEVGYRGSGVLNLTGGSVTSANGYLGSNAGSSATVNISSGSWAITDNLYIAHNTTGVLNLSGGSLSDTGGTLGYNVGSSGTANVSGGTWTNSGDLNVGNRGTGVLNISNGTVTAQTVYQGLNSGGSSTVNVSSGTFTSNTSYFLGYSGSGVLNLSGGSISNLSSSVATYAGSTGTANVSGGSWTNGGSIVIGEGGTGALNLSNGSVTAEVVYEGLNAGSTGTVNVSSGTFTSNTSYFLGYSGSGVLNLSGGSISNLSSSVATYAGSSGTANVSGGSWTSSGSLVIGESGSGALSLSGGSVSNTSAILGLNEGSSGTANVSGGTWTSSGDLTIGLQGDGTVTLTDSGTITVGAAGSGTVNMGSAYGSSGTLNFGSGGVVGTLNAAGIFGGSRDAIVNFNHTSSYSFGLTLTGAMTVNQFGPGTTTLTAASSFHGVTAPLGGTLELKFGDVSENILPSSTDVTMGSGTLKLSGTGTQALSGLIVRGSSAARIVMGADETLSIGSLSGSQAYSALNFNTAAGGANGASVGTGVIIVRRGQTAGMVINPSFTVTDATGFGLAAMYLDNQIYRLTSMNMDLLPAAGTTSDTNYFIDNNDGGSSSAGSSTLLVTSSEVAGSITVDTTAAAGILVLDAETTLSSNVWNFGGANGGHEYAIAGGALSAATAGGILQINNYNDAPVTIASPFSDIEGTTLLFMGTGTTVLSGNSINLQGLLVTSGTLDLADGGSFSYQGTATIGSQKGDNATLLISGGSLLGYMGVIGDGEGALGSVTLAASGSWTEAMGDLTIGNSGSGVLNVNAGGGATVQNAYLGVTAGSSGTVTVENGGIWYVNSGLSIGGAGAGTVNFNGGNIVVDQGGGTVTLGAHGVLNMGTGAGMGLLGAATVDGAPGSVVNLNYSSLIRNPRLGSVLTGSLAVTKSGSSTAAFNLQHSYTGGTSVNGGTLLLRFSSDLHPGDLISPASALTLGGGTLQLASNGTQTLHGLTTTQNTASRILLAADDTLDLGALTAAGSGSALNFNLVAGGADGGNIGSGIVLLSGQTAGAVINPGFTVTDATGFGLATVNGSGQVIRLTATSLLPASGADDSTDYRIDNNDGGSADPGSSTLIIAESETARSITVDTTATSGALTLGSGVLLSSDGWNFGGFGAHGYIVAAAPGAVGISAATPGGMMQINNYNAEIVSINAPILDNAGSGLRVGGTSITLLNGDASYKGETLVSSGTLFINGDHSAATGNITVNSAATLGGTGTLGGEIHVLNGGVLQPGNTLALGALYGTTATFDNNSVFYVNGESSLMTSLHLSGAATIHTGALLFINIATDLTAPRYTLLSAASGLDSITPFTLGAGALPEGYKLVYTGTALELASLNTTAFWTGKVDSNWATLSSGTTNWATATDGLTDTARLPSSPTDVTFSATGVGNTQTFLDVDFTLNSLTIASDTSISTTGTHALTVNTTTSVNALLSVNSGVTLINNSALTIATTGTLAGSGRVQMAGDQNIIVNGAIRVGDPVSPAPQVLRLITSGTGAIVMGADSTIQVNLLSGAGQGDNTSLLAVADRLNLHGTLNASAGGTLVIGNPHTMTAFAGGDQWKVIDLNGGDGAITGRLALNDSALALATGFIGTFDQTTGIYSIADYRPQLTAQSSGLPMANAMGQAIISGVQTATGDVNNHLFNLRSGGGEEDEESDGSISASLDYGIVVGEGDGIESPVARHVKRTRQWEVFTTVNYGNARLNPISNQAGVQVDSWASSVGLEKHLSRGLTLGFAATFLQSTQTYTGGLGRLDVEGPTLSAYLAYVQKSFWSSLLYSFGGYDLGSSRNPGLGLPVASGSTNAYVNSVQFNAGWNFRFQDRTLVTGPFVGIDYLHGSVDAYSETGGGLGALHYNKQSFESLVTRIGWSLSKKFDTEWAVITPQVRLSYERQNLRNNGTSVNLINAPFSASGGNQTPGQDYMVLGGGINFQFTPDFSMLLGYQVQLFRNNLASHFGSVRFGYKF